MAKSVAGRPFWRMRLLPATAALALLCRDPGAQPPAPASFAITRVSVIDGLDSLPRREQTVVIAAGRIVRVGPAGEVRVPPGARVVPGEGKFLIPGLWDMHVHLMVPRGRSVLGLFVANGVLGVRDLAGEWD